MQPWDELTERGKFRRLRPLAMAALRDYGVEVTRLSLVGGFTNAIFRVDASGAKYALRVDYMEDHSAASTEVELTWVTAVAADTDIEVCRVMRTSAGRLYTSAGAPGVPGERRCVLFEWIPGKPLDEDLRPDRYHQLGMISAKLHLHGAQFDPPSRPMPWDRVFYWPEEFDPIVYDQPQHARHFSGGRMEILERTIAAVTPAFERLNAREAQIIHGDLHPWNVHVKGRRMIVFDFEDVAWGHRVQDVAITLFYERDRPNYSELREAFVQGYQEVAQWPATYEGELEHFMAARTAMLVNFVLNLGGDHSEFFDRAFARLAKFLDTWT